MLHPSNKVNYKEEYDVIFDFLLHPENVELNNYQRSFYGTVKGTFDIKLFLLSQYEIKLRAITPAYYFYDEHQDDHVKFKNLKWIHPFEAYEDSFIAFDYSADQMEDMIKKRGKVLTYPTNSPSKNTLIKEFA